MHVVFRIATVVLVAGFASGCIFFSSPQDRALRRSPSFKDGYADGCAAAQEQGANFRVGPPHDDALYNSDKVYRAGWANGYQTCNPLQRAPGTTPNTGPIMQPNPGGGH
jgi:hypothetical protein